VNLNKETPLYKAFEYSISILGKNMKDAMIRELRTRIGMDLDEPSLSLVQLHEGLAILYGKAIAEIIMESVILKMDELVAKSNS
jgi:hypothetical protein